MIIFIKQIIIKFRSKSQIIFIVLLFQENLKFSIIFTINLDNEY